MAVQRDNFLFLIFNCLCASSGLPAFAAKKRNADFYESHDDLRFHPIGVYRENRYRKAREGSAKNARNAI